MAAAEDEDSVLNNQSPSLLGGVQAAKLMTIGAVEAALISMICSAQKPLRCSSASILYCPLGRFKVHSAMGLPRKA